MRDQWGKEAKNEKRREPDEPPKKKEKGETISKAI
jgi:hypothetical protein